MVVRVHRDPPLAPVPLPPPGAGTERVYASPADYHGRSAYTYRWRPAPDLRTHLYRALDEAIYQADWGSRPRPELTDSDLDAFPDERVEPHWDWATRARVAEELNRLNDMDHDQAMACYRGLSDDALRVLAGLPGTERAFSQVTIAPLDPDDPASADRLGPDDPAGHTLDPDLRAYVDTLDGRAGNRYLYRAVAVDLAHNRSPLGPAGPPVWLPDTVPPARRCSRPPGATGRSPCAGRRTPTATWTSTCCTGPTTTKRRRTCAP